MTNSTKEHRKKYFNSNNPVTKIFVTVLVIAIIVFIIKATGQKKNNNLPVTQYKSLTNENSIKKANTIENIKQISSDNRGQKNISVAFSQIIPTPPVPSSISGFVEDKIEEGVDYVGDTAGSAIKKSLNDNAGLHTSSSGEAHGGGGSLRGF